MIGLTDGSCPRKFGTKGIPVGGVFCCTPKMYLTIFSQKSKQLNVVSGIGSTNLYIAVVSVVGQQTRVWYRAGIVMLLYKPSKLMKQPKPLDYKPQKQI